MASLAESGNGTIFLRKNGAVWQKVAEIISFSGPNLSRDTIDVTSMDSVDGYREFIGGLRDGGEVSFDMNFRRDTYEIIKADLENNTNQTYEILLPDAENTSFKFTGLVTAMGMEIPNDDKMTNSVTIKISGEAQEASGSVS